MAGRSPAARREVLMSRHESGLILARGQAPSGVSPNFVYLAGIEEPKAVLLLARDGVRIMTGRNHPGPDYVRGRMARQLLFLPPPDPLAARWGEDAAATTESVDAAAAGFDAVLPLEALGPLLEQVLARASSLGYVRGAPPALAGRSDADGTFVARIRRSFFALALADATPAVHELRRIKDEAEIAKIERSIALTAQALERLLPIVRAGLGEHELEAEITRTYRAHGARHAFDPIVASGPNALRLHSRENSGRVGQGDVLLIDTGAKLDGYCSDVTRSWPVGGRFSARQREVYEAVLEARRAATAACRPGALLADIHTRAWEVLDAAGLGEFFIHGTSHHLGLETHDAGDVHRPLEAGCVITVEPGVYLPQEGLGVRIEDDVLVTDGPPRLLSAAIVADADEIERGMA